MDTMTSNTTDETNPLSLANKVAIVTGASRGIGAGIALELAHHSAKVSFSQILLRILNADPSDIDSYHIHISRELKRRR